MLILDWQAFADEIKFNNRFFPQSNQILQAIDEMFDKHIETLEPGTKFYRARLIELSEMRIYKETLSGYAEKESMAPDAHFATAQRASPERIAYLYVAQDEYTALSETRPGLLSFISVAELEAIDKLNIFDLWVDINTPRFDSNHFQLARCFSAVIAEREKELDYLPMQFVAEYVKKKGVDGIRYVSYQSQVGKNIVIFEKDKVKFLQSKIIYNQNVSYSFLDLTNPERKPVVNEAERSPLPKDFADRIKSSVQINQWENLKNNSG